MHPPESALALAGATTRAPADARLLSAFEDAFVLDTSSGGFAGAIVDTVVRDPTDGGRKRGHAVGGVAETCCGRGVVGGARGGGAGQRAAELCGESCYAACLRGGVLSVYLVVY